MCCGNQRQQISTKSRPVSGPVQSSPIAPAAPRQSLPRGGVYFEYCGGSALTVVSPLTARSYRFDRPGARIVPDPRDTPWLTFVPQLKRIGG
jgi:hypothetical protein